MRIGSSIKLSCSSKPHDTRRTSFLSTPTSSFFIIPVLFAICLSRDRCSCVSRRAVSKRRNYPIRKANCECQNLNQLDTGLSHIYSSSFTVHTVRSYTQYTVAGIYNRQFLAAESHIKSPNNNNKSKFLVHGLQKADNHNFCNSTNWNLVFGSGEPHRSVWSHNNLKSTMELIW